MTGRSWTVIAALYRSGSLVGLGSAASLVSVEVTLDVGRLSVE